MKVCFRDQDITICVPSLR